MGGATAEPVRTITVTVNGDTHDIAVRDEESAVEVLRDRLRLTGTKLVCGEGVCGACTVLLDGVPVTSCLLPASALDGRAVKTIEAFDSHPVQRAFVAHDALQCGYCTPGFVVEAIAFFERWRAQHGAAEPKRDDVVQALAGHLCRCGAYLGIMAAVRDACAGRFDAGDVAGPRLDALAKVTGRAVYTTDVHHAEQLEGLILRSPHAHARVRAIDFSAARALPGVQAAVELVGRNESVRYVGQAVAAVAAIDRQTAERALALTRVDYETLPAAVGMAAARAEGAPLVYSGWWRRPPNASEGPLIPTCWHGNVRGPLGVLSQRRRKARRLIAEARANRDPLLVEGTWCADVQVHTAFEPHACVARWQGDALEVHVSTQAAAEVAHQIAKRFGLAHDKVRVIAQYVGGGFGAKLQLTPETVAAVALAREAGRPVRVALERHEEMSVAGYRPGAEMKLALLASRTGGLRALQLHAYGDSGIAAGSQVAMLARTMYPAPAKELLDYDVVNNLAPGTPFRGPGAPLTLWAVEQAVDEAAHRLDESPIALRRRLDPDPLRARLYDWAEGLALWKSRPTTGSERGRFRRGVGVAAANWLYFFQTDCHVEVGIDGGRLYVATAVQDIGTGIRSVLAHAVAGAFALAPAQVDVRIGDTRLVKGPTSGGSRTTTTVVPAALAAVERLHERLVEEVGVKRGLQDARPEKAGIRHAAGLMPWRQVIAAAPTMVETSDRPSDDHSASRAGPPLAGTGPMGVVTRWLLGWFLKLGIGRGYTGAVHVSEVEVDTLLGKTRVLKVAGGIAAGRIAVPVLARNQCYGGVIQGIGYALYEHREVDVPSGVVLTGGLEDYRIPGIGDVPEIDIHFDEEGFEHVRSGGVGLGEVATVGVAASLGNAVYNATGWRPRALPIRPDRLIQGLSP